MRGGAIAFQKSDSKLAEELIEIAAYEYDDLVISMQDIFIGVDQYVTKSRLFWKEHLLTYRKKYEKYCNPYRTYASTSFSRCYITINDKSKCEHWFINCFLRAIELLILVSLILNMNGLE